ncbi:hypothetical protein BJV85_001738 [Clostridium acetobutylicum]|uniref:Uncharacterized protein n=2 Tax=Clostridium acetobutylicum TaxID=1488 RepID=Q97H71_CLOAB|nr:MULTISPECIES: hypothetical protein [Clostridium]AAK80100.1 Hypothetical protein CA_C2142 [Clostridium acetobutylicum ATCC 824]ADZ21193.1 hypothetical protein CEA_G2156 [Clostridium acetobutylicum EA 2018]AEI32198.1 hypothetical protein SMB_G2175 [Clostridium acetobutylicum DSM 1731]AWV79475.1 hypothetical protein DK921_05040 [Clostridium acetobutylicum]MBC2394554.1 hypothetical protein [Clostridium acetobutylicum]
MAGIILIFMGIILIIMNVKAIKNDTSFETNFENRIKNTDEYDLKIGELRQEFAETILEMQQEIEKLSNGEDTNTYKINEKIDDSKYRAKNQGINVLIDKDDDIIKENENEKISKVRKLLEDGNTVDQISEKLDLGKGEVLLIQKLYTN